jgi:hypothetical protein
MGSASRVVLRRALDENDSMSWGRKQQEAEELDLNPGDSTTDTLVDGMRREEDQQPEEDALEAMERGMEMAGAGQWRAALAAFDFALNHHMNQTVATSRTPASDGACRPLFFSQLKRDPPTKIELIKIKQVRRHFQHHL